MVVLLHSPVQCGVRGPVVMMKAISIIMHSNRIIRMVAQVQLITIIVGGVGDRNS